MKNLQQNWDSLYSLAKGKRQQTYTSTKISSLVIYSIFILWAINVSLPLIVSEGSIASCGLCHNFISIIAILIPGIDIIAGESTFPQAMALQIALSWVIIIFLVMILLFNRKTDSGFKSLFGLKSFLVIFIWILNEFVFGLVISYFHGVGFDLHGTKTGLLHFLVQYKIGAGILISFMIFYEVVLLVWVASYCKIILKNLFKGE